VSPWSGFHSFGSLKPRVLPTLQDFYLVGSPAVFVQLSGAPCSAYSVGLPFVWLLGCVRSALWRRQVLPSVSGEV